MHKDNRKSGCWKLVFTSLLIVLLAGAAEAAKFTTFYSFQGGSDGADPRDVVADKAGNLYGVTFNGGLYNAGTIFQLTQSGGVWTNTVLYNFCAKALCADGQAPDSTLVLDKKGNLYGITLWGGKQTCQFGCGVVFGLHPTKGGWQYKVLHQFDHSSGYYPQARLTLDKAGNIYGTTSDADGLGHGTVFALTLSHDHVVHKVVYAFTELGNDGSGPFAGVTFDQAGNLYGTTAYGGDHGAGTVYRITPSNGGWTHQTIYSFNNDRIDGQIPYSGVTLDAAGSVYGTTYTGGDYNNNICQDGCGIVYQLTSSGETWDETVLYTFSGGADGAFPSTQLIFDKSGHIYGSASQGGNPSCDDGYGCGVVFELTQANGTWSETVLHHFSGGKDGWGPGGDLFFGPKGVLVGSAGYGVPYNSGNLFWLKP